MNIALRVSKAAAILALAMPVAALAQYAGTSHPDDSPILNSPDVPAQPAYQAIPATTLTAQPALKPRPGIPMDAAPATARVTEPMTSETTGTISSNPSDIDGGIVTRIPGPPNELPVGTLVKVRLGTEISTATTASGSTFTAQLIEPVERDGHVLLPAGSMLAGLVTEVHGGKRISGAASIHLRPTSVTLPDGTRYRLHGQVIDTDIFKQVKVDQEGTIIRRDHAGKTAATMALTTGSGAAAGAIIAGPPGAVVGAGVGAGVSTVVWLKQDRQTELPVDTKIIFSLIEPLRVGIE